MAPRTAKAKKVEEVKVSELNKKGKGKNKTVVDDVELPVEDLNEKVPMSTVKKTKRGKADDLQNLETNGNTEVSAPPSKRGRKKKADEKIQEEIVNDIDVGEKDTDANGETHKNGYHDDDEKNNGVSEDKEHTDKSRKKTNKKEVNSSKKNVKDDEIKEKDMDNDSQNAVEGKTKETKKSAKGRGRKAPAKPKQDEENIESQEQVTDDKNGDTVESTSKSKKKPEAKPVEEDQEEEENDDKPPEEPKKKGKAKGRKITAKKAQSKVDSVENEGHDEHVNEELDGQEETEHTAEQNEMDEEPADKKAKGKRGKKVQESATSDVAQEAGEPASKRRRKPVEDKAKSEDKVKKAPKNKSVTNYEDIDFSNSSKNAKGKEWNFKISSWNVDGIRAWSSKGGLDYFKYEKPDILCVQETKCSQDKLPEEVKNYPGYHAYWCSSDKDGYAGVGIYTTKLAISVQYGLQNEELDNDGRIITAEYEQFYLICTYVPNAGRKLVTLPRRLQWNEEFRRHVKELDKKKPVIICGDMNVAHNEIDLANPKTNRKNAGFTDEERSGMTELLGDGFIDTFRHLYPDKSNTYTFWTYMMNARSKNVGWRLDYFIVSERLLPSLCDNVIRDEVFGSDHCPIALFLHLTNAEKPKE